MTKHPIPRCESLASGTIDRHQWSTASSRPTFYLFGGGSNDNGGGGSISGISILKFVVSRFGGSTQ